MSVCGLGVSFLAIYSFVLLTTSVWTLNQLPRDLLFVIIALDDMSELRMSESGIYELGDV